ncbi:MAG TPA: hypothetical protein VFG25_04640 [Nitrosopumilaceae archaeon]|nr:hypothetical protein [Nitrosopumilaceae archaeon]
MDLNKKVFGSIAVKEIIGGEPPLYPETTNRLENEFRFLVNELNKKSRDELEKSLHEQKEIIKQMNSKSGAMALAQDKIKLFTDFSFKYTQEIENKLKSFV